MARASIVVGVVAIAAIPVAVVASLFLDEVGLVWAIEVAVPVALILGLVAVSLARRAQFRVDRSVTREGARVVRFARTLAWASLYLGTSGAIALGFYSALVLRG